MLFCSRDVSFARSENTPDGRDVMALECIERNGCGCWEMCCWHDRDVNDVRPAKAPGSREEMLLE